MKSTHRPGTWPVSTQADRYDKLFCSREDQRVYDVCHLWIDKEIPFVALRRVYSYWAVAHLKMMRPFSLLELRPRLGPLEQQVLRKLWKHGSATVRELLADGEFHQAYTTVMTAVDRLYKKGLVDRVAEGRAFRFSPRHSFEELQRVTALGSIRQLLGSGDPSSLALSYLVEALSNHDAELLDDLQVLVERKRRQLKDQEKLRKDP